MLEPEYLQSVPDTLVDLYAQAETDILADMARRISGFDLYIPSADFQRRKLEELGMARSEIVAQLSRLAGKSRKELERLMGQAGAKALEADETIYRAAGLAAGPLKASPEVQKVLAAGLKKTNGLFTNLTKTTARTATRQFERALDRAYMRVTSGAFSPAVAIKGAVKELAGAGIGAVTCPSGHTDTVEVAVRRAVITGVNQTCLQMQEVRAEELGVDLVETTAHAGARPSHAEWQGQIFSRSGKSSKYPDFVQSTGYGTGAGLGGWNCSHSFFPYIEGLPRAYSDKQLSDYQAKDYTYNGEKMTKYEALQKQRELERNIRRWKRENLTMKAAGQDTAESSAKLTQWRRAKKDFLEQTGLKDQSEREMTARRVVPQVTKSVNTAITQKSLAEGPQERYNRKKAEAIIRIASNETPKAINPGNQNKHIKGGKGYIEGRSYIYGGLAAAQALVDQYSGTGEPILTRNGEWAHKEYVCADHPVGAVVEPETEEETETRAFMIHYGKRGTHVVPAKEGRK